jgi:predicted Rossmann-fold nucleotide-binding protein
VLTLVQTGKMRKPIVLVGVDHWQGLVDWIEDVLVRDGRISAPDTSLFTVTDDIDEAASIMIDAAREGMASAMHAE